MTNVIQFRARAKDKPSQVVPTEELSIYIDVLAHMRNHAICHNDLEFVKQLDPLLQQAIDNGTVYADIHDEALKARIRTLLDGDDPDFFYWKPLYEKIVND